MGLSHAAIEGVLISHGMSYDEINRALAPSPQIIRTVQDFEALDPETVVLCGRRDVLVAREALDYGRAALARVLPAVVITTGEHARACRQALEGATT